MIPTCIPQLSEREKEYLVECVETNYVSSIGPFVDEFQDKLSEVTQTSGAFCTTTGTAAIHLALETIGVESDDLVIIPSLTFIATANAVNYCGADPWIMDIHPEDWTLNPTQLNELLQQHTERRNQELIHQETGRRVSAILPVHTLGCPAHMKEIRSIADQFDLPVVADGAAAIGATYRGEPIGQHADFTTFSFNGNKTITCGGGGALVSPSESLIEQAQHLGSTAREGREYHHDEVGFNYRMTNLQAAVGVGQIEQLDGFIDRKRAIRSDYNNFFKDIEGVSPFPDPDYAESSCWFSGFLVEEDHPLATTQIRQRLEDRDIESPPFWKPIHRQPPYSDAPAADQPHSESIWERIVTLPSSVGLSEADQATVVETLNDILNTSNPNNE